MQKSIVGWESSSRETTKTNGVVCPDLITNTYQDILAMLQTTSGQGRLLALVYLAGGKIGA